MKLYVVRHGETDFNSQRRYAGSTDVPLNEVGISQARELAQRLEGTQLDIVVSSPLLRARQTAEIICAALNTWFVVIDAFAERDMGVYEGLTREEAMRKYPDLWNRLGARKPDDAPTDGETIRQCDARVTNGLERLLRDYPDKSVLLVCHGFVARLINRYAQGLSYGDMHGFSAENCGIYAYTL